MRFFLDPLLDAASSITRMRASDYLLTIICVVRLRLVPDGISMPVMEDEQPGLRRAEYFDDGLGTSPIFGGDHAPFKPRTDLTLFGRGHVPNGRRATSLLVTLGVNDWRKSLDLIGDRVWLRGVDLELSPPEPFESMSLRMENAFGGIGSPYNPWGKGFGTLDDEPGSTLPACNIHPAGTRHVRWDSNIPPAGFSPLPSDLLPRQALQGTYDETWLLKRNPLPPDDFDWAFHNVAPTDQQFSPYLKGDETLYFENLHPKHNRFSSQLWGRRPRLLLRRIPKATQEPQIEEVRTVLDSVHVDTESMTIDLGWRAVSSTPDAEARDVTHCYVTTEPLAEPPQPLSVHVAAFQLHLSPEMTPFEPPLPPPPPPPEDDSDERAMAELEALVTLQEAVKSLPLAQSLKDAVAAAKTSTEVKALIDVILKS